MIRTGKLTDILNALDTRAVYALLTAAVLLVFALDYVLVLRLQLGGVAALAKRSVELKRDIAILQNNKARMEQLRRERDILKMDHTAVKRMTHRKDDIPVVLEMISSAANRYDVKIDQLVPQPLEDKPLLKTAEGSYFSQPILVQLRAGYHDFARMIDQLVHEGAFWKIDSLDFAAGMESQKHTVKMTIRVLVLAK